MCLNVPQFATTHSSWSHRVTNTARTVSFIDHVLKLVVRSALIDHKSIKDTYPEDDVKCYIFF